MRKRIGAMVIGATLLSIGGCDSPSPDAEPDPVFKFAHKHFFVSPNGHDHASGLDPTQPLQNIQTALNHAHPGDTVHLLAGLYWQDLRSVRDGDPLAPIRISSAPGAVIKGSGASRVIELNHSYITLSGITIDGYVSDTEYRDKLLYIKGKDTNGVTGIRVVSGHFRHAGGECLRLKHFAHHNEIAHSTFQHCGLRDYKLNRGKKNGEAIYIGTAPEQIALDFNPTRNPDASNHNWVHNNYIDTQGNECIDIKEEASYNVLEFNYCTGQKDSLSAGISSRGNDNIIRFNLVTGNVGAGIRLGGDTQNDGINNQIYGNTLLHNQYSALKIQAQPQGKICGNRVDNNTKIVRGTYSSLVEPQQACR